MMERVSIAWRRKVDNDGCIWNFENTEMGIEMEMDIQEIPPLFYFICLGSR